MAPRINVTRAHKSLRADRRSLCRVAGDSRTRLRNTSSNSLVARPIAVDQKSVDSSRGIQRVPVITRHLPDRSTKSRGRGAFQVQWSAAVASTAIPEAVFLDAQVFENASFNFKTRAFMALKRHLASERLRLVITDITVAEVRSRIVKSVRREAGAHQKFRKEARVLRSSSATDVARTLVELDSDAIAKELQDAFADFLKNNKAHVIDTTAHPIGKVFERYFASKPPFGSGDKKSEFPDAFVVAALISWTKKQRADLFVVSADKLLGNACDECRELHPKSTLIEVLDHVASDDKKLAEFIREQLIERQHVVAKEAKNDFLDLGFYIEDEEGDLTIDVLSIEPSGDPEIMEVSGKDATVQMAFEADLDAHLSYEDSNTGIWDSEDKVMLFMEHRSLTVKHSEELIMEVHATFEGINPKKFHMDSIELVEPSESIGISTPNADYDDER
jgi:hypothetical protein